MGTECSTFTLSTLNCTAGKGRTGWKTGTLNGAEAALEVKDANDSIKQGLHTAGQMLERQTATIPCVP